MSSCETIGIDLGTTNSCVAVYQNGTVIILANEHGHKTIPSCVSFLDTGRLVGDAAKEQMGQNPNNTIFDAKRLIGRKFSDDNVQNSIKQFPFEVKEEAGKPIIEVYHHGERRSFTPEEISAIILENLKEIAENYLGHTVTDAVITVPAYFNYEQRQATTDAAMISGLNPIQILEEPIAAALAYGLDKYIQGERIILTFDLGGGTLNVSILKINEGSSFTIISTAGDEHLGGEHFDQRMVERCMEEFQKITRMDMSKDPQAIQRLRTACEHAKRTLSSLTEAMVDIESLHEGFNFQYKMTRVCFEELCDDLFSQALESVKKALRDAKMEKSKINDIVLAGGSTYIPRIQKLLTELFGGRNLNCSINPDEIVAFGAALQAAALSKPKEKEDNQLAAENKNEEKRITSRSGLEAYALEMKNALYEYGDHIPSFERDRAHCACDSTLKWIETHQLAGEEEIELQWKNLSAVCR